LYCVSDKRRPNDASFFVFIPCLLYHTSSSKHGVLYIMHTHWNIQLMNNTKPSIQWRFMVFNLLLLGWLSFWLWQNNQAVEIPEAILPADQKVQCVSYAPYYGKEQTPFKVGTVITKAQIDHDLNRIASRSACVRIYSVGQGLDYVPEAAQRLGLKVLVGAWIGWTAQDNDKEIHLATSLANQYPDTVEGLIIGNEVLLRGEQTEEAMQAYIARAKQLTKTPVTYADVWEFWLKHSKLEQSVDFVTVHLLPYWENEPQSVAQSIQHANVVMDKLHQAFTKPILIGETGWPSIGRQRGLSTPSQLNQATYIRTFLREAHQKQWRYNLIEAFDQPWKRVLEGTVGGFWGIYDTELNPKFSYTGKVAERQDQASPIVFGMAGALALMLFTYMLGEQRKISLISMAILGALAGLATMLQWEYLNVACGDGTWLTALICVPKAGQPLVDIVMVLQWFSFGGALLASWLIVSSVPALLYKQSQLAMRIIHVATLALLIGAVTIGILLAVDGRYRDFPVHLYALPALQLSLGLRLLASNIRFAHAGYLALAVASVTTALICYLIEPLNSNALYWLAITSLLTMPLLFKKQ
jgi:exo-beta-1,3-glucanase (GH17 family)